MTDVVGTGATWPYYNQDNIAKAAKKNRGDLGKDDFLKILITQLQTQDPTSPLQDKDFIAQMTQFSAVEQTMNMASEMKLLRQSMGIASSLIGKQIEWSMKQMGSDGKDTGETVTKSGKVEAITFKDGVQYAKVGSDSVPLDQITKIWEGTGG